MTRRLVECVPNFSEGRDRGKLDAIATAVRDSGAAVLRAESDRDHNRGVVTFAGAPEAVAGGAFRAIAKAKELIDLREHKGVHPRMGAADVVPFVPLEGVTMEECAALARQTGERVWKELGIPVYFYEAAALKPERVRLENVRRGEFEKPEMAPDLGGPDPHPSAGAVIIGARRILVAFNINLATPELGVARRIARKVRASAGGLPFVKALGLLLESRGQAQVSLNLTNYEVTSPEEAFAAVEAAAREEGVQVAGTELVGLVPRAAVKEGGRAFALCADFGPHRILENRLAEAFPVE